MEIHPVDYGYEPNYFEPGFEKDILKRHGYLRVVKVELVCADIDVVRFSDIIVQECRTGQRGDGWIFVSDVKKAIRIRDGAPLRAAA